MKISEFSELQKQMFAKCVETARKKGHDYADEGDTLSSFGRFVKVCNILSIDRTTCKGDALSHVIACIDRICNLEKRGKARNPMNESIEDSVKDAHIYLNLYFALSIEE